MIEVRANKTLLTIYWLTLILVPLHIIWMFNIDKQFYIGVSKEYDSTYTLFIFYELFIMLFSIMGIDENKFTNIYTITNYSILYMIFVNILSYLPVWFTYVYKPGNGLIIFNFIGIMITIVIFIIGLICFDYIKVSINIKSNDINNKEAGNNSHIDQ